MSIFLLVQLLVEPSNRFNEQSVLSFLALSLKLCKFLKVVYMPPFLIEKTCTADKYISNPSS